MHTKLTESYSFASVSLLFSFSWKGRGDIYTALDEESESEVEHLEILHPDSTI